MSDRSQSGKRCENPEPGLRSAVAPRALAVPRGLAVLQALAPLAAVALTALIMVLAGGEAQAQAATAGGRQTAPRPAAARVENASAFSFERTVLRAELPVVVDFWAPWCIPCRELDAPLAALAADFAGRARVVRVNVEWSSRVARRFDVVALPTVLIFSRGELVSRSTGAASKEDLEELLAAQLAPAAVAGVTPVKYPGGRPPLAASFPRRSP